MQNPGNDTEEIRDKYVSHCPPYPLNAWANAKRKGLELASQTSSNALFAESWLGIKPIPVFYSL